MRLNKDDIDLLFDELEHTFDTEEPKLGHQNRFAAKLAQQPIKKKKTHITKWLIAASIAAVLGISLFTNQSNHQAQYASFSPEVSKAQAYFSGILSEQIEILEKEKNPLTKQIVVDALQQLDMLEKDYNQLEKELLANGEDKRIIHAMITNFQKRIDLLQHVLTTVEQVKTINTQTNETTL